MARPLFTPTGDLREDIARLMGQDLERSSPARPPLATEAERCFFRIKGISNLWGKSQDEREKMKALGQTIEDLLTGLYARRVPFAYLILGQEREIKIYWGIPMSLGDDRFLPQLLRGSLPGVTLEEAEPALLLRELSALQHCAALTGIPAPKEGERLERLLRGLYGERWAYLIASGPLEMGRIAATLETLAEEARRVKNTYLRKSSIEEDNHPLARYYLELLQAALAKYKRGRVQGCWEARALLFTAEPGILERGMALLASIYSGERSLPMPIRLHRCSSMAEAEEARLPSTVLNTSDLSLLAQLPKREMPGYQVLPHSRFALALPEVHPQAESPTIALGQVLHHKRSTGNWLELEVTDLTKHAFITGVTGSGKTETCHFLLDQLWREHGVPYLVIEPAKREYRELRAAPGHEDLRIFTLGDEREAPFRMNPFDVPQGIHVQTHIDLLRTLFNATFAGLYPPMPYLLEEALYEIYTERGWDLASGEGGLSPRLSDLCAKVEEAVERAGYDPEVTQNVRTALKVRLNSLRIGAKGRMLDSRRSIPMEELLQEPTILELAAIGDPEVVAFMMGLLLVRLYEYRAAEARGGQEKMKLKHITLIEEAHRFLAKQPQQAHPDLSQIRGQALEGFSNLLAEVRAFGEGLIIIDQSPTKLHPDVLKGTNLKVVHRLVAEDDRKAVGGSMVLDESQMKALATLAVGEAVVYAEGLHRPFLIKPPLFREHALQGEQLRRGVREGMRRFYEAHPELLHHNHDEPRGADEQLLREFAAIIMESKGDRLWERLAELSLEAATARAKDDEARTALALRLAQEAAARLGLPEAEREKLTRNLRYALQQRLGTEVEAS